MQRIPLFFLGDDCSDVVSTAWRTETRLAEKAHFAGFFTDHVGIAQPRTLARELRHIVAFGSSDTTSRAAVLTPLVVLFRRNARVCFRRFRRGRKDSAAGTGRGAGDFASRDRLPSG